MQSRPKCHALHGQDRCDSAAQTGERATWRVIALTVATMLVEVNPADGGGD